MSKRLLIVCIYTCVCVEKENTTLILGHDSFFRTLSVLAGVALSLCCVKGLVKDLVILISSFALKMENKKVKVNSTCSTSCRLARAPGRGGHSNLCLQVNLCSRVLTCVHL